MKGILIAQKPRDCENIASGKKTVIACKKMPKLQTPFKVYIYCTNQKINGEILLTYDKKVEGRNRGFRENGDIPLAGKVIGEFICDKVTPLVPLALRGFEVLDKTLKTMCLTTLYAWHITELKIYDTPKELKDFLLPCGGKICWGCNLLNVKDADCINRGKRYATRPPRGWMYVREVEL